MARNYVSPFLCGFFLLAHVVGAAAKAQESFPLPMNNEEDVAATPLAPLQAAAGFKVPEGFQVSLFASEPDVQNPIAMNWDTQGRLWIAENYTYSGRQERFDLNLRDRVVVFEDSDHDGIPEKRTVFIDSIQMLTSVAVGYGGVWLMCPPQLLFVPDADEDLIPDGPAQVVLDGFEVASENYHNFANGLRFGPDGWLYGRCGGSCPGRIGTPGSDAANRVALEGGMWRYQPRLGSVEVLVHGTTNPWGHDWNDVAECFFTNTVNGHLWHLIPGAHYARPFTLDPNSRTYEAIDMHADHYHFDTGQGWQASRDGAANNLGGGHAHCGAMIYLGQQWPRQYYNSLLTLNLHGRRANHEVLNRSGSGYLATHGEDLLLSDDPFFRGMDLTYGPDGSVFIIDWSDTGECHERTGVHRQSGRIFRVNYGLANSAAVAIPTDENAANPTWQLGAEWSARSARLLIARQVSQGWRPDSDTVNQFAALVAHASEPQAVRAMLTLHAMDAFIQDERSLLELLHHRHEAVRAWAIRLLTEQWPLDDCYGPRAVPPHQSQSSFRENHFAAIMELAAKEISPAVRLVLASTLQRLPVQRRITLATLLTRGPQDADDHNLPLLVWYGLIPTAEADPQRLATFALHCKWPKTQRFAVRRLAEISTQQPAGLETLVAGLLMDPNADFENCLNGLADGFRGWRKAVPPRSWSLLADQLQATTAPRVQELINQLNVVFGDGRTLTELKQLALDPQAEPGLRVSAIEALVSQPDNDALDICLAVLRDPRFNGAALKGFARYEDPQVAREIIRSYRSFRAPLRPRVIALLSSRASFAEELLTAVAAKQIPLSDITAYDVRQLKLLEVDSINTRVKELWGNTREATLDKRERIQSLKNALSTQPDLDLKELQHGRKLFEVHCAKCHKLYGHGESIGPDLTGAQRSNLDYLLENIVDPSAVVAKDFCLSVIALDDGRIINGLIVANSERSLTLQTQTELITFDREQIERIRESDLSPMPEGLLDQLSDVQIRQLIGYLRLPQQVSLTESDAIP
jgi:putative membrane-bound dehydrogenase-like protein